MDVLLHVNLYDLLHILLLNKVDDLATVRHNFERGASHQYFFVFKNLPVSESSHDA